MVVSSASSVAAGQPFDVTASVRDPRNDPISYTIKVSGKYATGDATLTNAAFTQTGNGTFRVTAPQQLGVWKVYIFAQDGKGNVGIETRSFRVGAASGRRHRPGARPAGHGLVIPAVPEPRAR